MFKISQKDRIINRILYHYILFMIITSALLFMFMKSVRSDDNIFRWSMSTAYVGLIFLAATLITGPLNIMRHRPNPVTTDLRRDLGIWSAFICVAHVVVGLQVHFRGRMHLYFLEEAGQSKELVLRFGQFGFANHTGLIATVIVLLLLAVSNDFFLRKLKPVKWKNVQRLNYVAIMLVAVHGILYQIIEKRKISFIILFSSLLIVTLIVQLTGFLKLRLKSEFKNT